MIYISAGHHSKAQGASYNDITEYQLTVKWADYIHDLLGDKALRVPNGHLKSKVGFINIGATNQDIAIEIHFNSSKKWKDLNDNGVIDDGEMINMGVGSETLYYPGSKTGLLAAKIMQYHLAQVFPPNRGEKEGWYQMNKSKGADFFLRKTRCTSLIIEPEFIDNIDVINTNMASACDAIADALLEITGN